MAHRFERSSRYGRRPRVLRPNSRVLVVCEGQVTEPNYLNRIRNHYRNALVDVTVRGEGADPKIVVETAVEMKKLAEREARRARDEFLKYDQVWCVFDRDEHRRFEDAVQQARAHEIQLAISNPCFELWILLHFRDERGHIERHRVQAACRELMPGYQREAPFDVLAPLYGDAVRRAKALSQWQLEQGRPNGNPTTQVHELTETIRELGMGWALRRIGQK